MSTGLVICSACRREVHQDGGRPAPDQPAGWRHCEDQSPRCEGATSRYPENAGEIVGLYCGADDDAGRFPRRARRFPHPIAGPDPKLPRPTQQQRIAALTAMTPIARGNYLRHFPGDRELVRRIERQGRKTRKAIEDAKRKAVVEQNRAQLEREAQEERAAAPLNGRRGDRIIVDDPHQPLIVAPTFARAKRYAREVNGHPIGQPHQLEGHTGRRVIALGFVHLPDEMRFAVLKLQPTNTVELWP